MLLCICKSFIKESYYYWTDRVEIWHVWLCPAH